VIHPQRLFFRPTNQGGGGAGWVGERRKRETVLFSVKIR